MPVTRWLLWTLAGIILGGIVHLGTILALPRTASQDAYARLEPITPVNQMTAIPRPTAAKALMPYMDPAFAVAVCRYDLGRGPMKLTAPVSQAYTSVTFYTKLGVAYYGINDRAAGRRTIELYLMTTAQHEAMPDEEDVTAADRLIIESPGTTGLIVLRALSPEPSLMPMAQAAAAAGRCLAQTP
jgi:uncharacterized membrane protein